jgi:hypothetical protein
VIRSSGRGKLLAWLVRMWSRLMRMGVSNDAQA